MVEFVLNQQVGLQKFLNTFCQLIRSRGADRGRDGCRVPLPWTGTRSPFGFSPDDASAPWLPQPAAWAGLTVAAQDADPASMLSLYRRALAIRSESLTSLPEDITWLDFGDDVVGFRRGEFTCVVNFGAPETRHGGTPAELK